ncbi:DNA translocase FtsK 4TM domain-containing protein [Shimia sp. R11_0]|uniref:DNA translocase FtsK n=1 Tax=Shimia sp. R11_0 TaxID=2821096 RepID=UPI001ADA5BAE|nr:DNA translocase FtsK [Shimia sp. R11_0]MBO9478601.1 DNA translocase FtsK 4TM domain-containing protein [Shimia sp. R11_0]
MAYQARGRGPLLDSSTQAAVEKRGKELIGIVLIVLAVMSAAMILSYSPNDPSWISVTDAPVQNVLGRFGASIAAPLFIIIGWGSLGVALLLGIWGGRFAFHIGEERAQSRVIFAPIMLAMGAIYASTLTPSTDWSHAFGMGGLFGDTVTGALLTILPIGAQSGVKVMSLFAGIAFIGISAFVLGFTKLELSRLARTFVVGLVLSYDFLMRLLGKGATGAVQAAKAAQERRVERRAVSHDEAAYAYVTEEHWDENVFDEEDSYPAPETIEKPKPRLRMPALIKRAEPEPETLPEPELVDNLFTSEWNDAPEADRISAKIADVMRTRARRGEAVSPPELHPDKPLTKGRGRGPDPLLLDMTGPQEATHAPASAMPVVVGARQEPPLSADPMMVSELPEVETFGQPQEIEVGTPVVDQHAPVNESVPMQAIPSDAYVSAPIPVAAPKKVVQPRVHKAVAPSARAKAEAQPSLAFEESGTEYELPPLGLLENPLDISRHHLSDEALEENARMLETVLDDYGVKGEIVSVRPGPVVTMYELEPAPGLKASRVIGLADDIARSMSALSARVSTVPGRSVIGIELPNEHREKVVLREILAARDFGDSNMKLPLALGKDIGGDPIVANLAKMPHLLIAGTTGSGKSVAINTMILSLLYRLTPEDCRLIMIDPKMLELSVYDGIPHLLSPVVTDPKKAVVALKWVVGEMEDRYRKMSKMGVRNIDGYNSRVTDALSKGETFSRTVQTGFDEETGEPVFETEEILPEKMPYIVVIVDEMADLMMVAGKEIEACIQRLAQMARASGIHLIMATQRPSVDVITGTIKANFPTRISFQVTSKVDSRTILGEMGAEQLLGMGDMLYMAGGAKITRCHGPFVSDEEVEEIVNHLKSYGPPEYIGGVVEGPDEGKSEGIDAVLGLSTGGNTNGEDALYDSAVAIVIQDRKCSTSYIQRKLAIGYNKAARLVEQMEEEGLVSPANHVGKREILVPEQ